MKKILVIIILIIALSGCSTNESDELKLYNSYVKELKQVEKSNNNIPFNINVYVDKIIETEVMYRVIIDKPQIPLRNIETIVIHDKNTQDIFPSSGIFDDKLSLIPDVINKSSNYVEGIILIGYIPYEKKKKNLNATFKVLVKYEDDDGITHKVFYSINK